MSFCGLICTSMCVMCLYLYEKASQAASKGKRHKHGTELEDLPVGKLCHASVSLPLPSNRQHLSSGTRLEDKREDNQNCSMPCCAQ